MKTITMRARITKDGVLRLEVPCDLPPGPAEVVLVVQPGDTTSVTKSDLPYRSLHGLWAGKLPDVDTEADLQDMHRQWESSLEGTE